MNTPDSKPKLRWPIDLRIENFDGNDLLIVTCPAGISLKPLALVAAVAPIVQCFDGTLTVDEIASKFAQYGVGPALVQQLASILDDHLFLATPRFFAAEQSVKDEFLALKIRPAALAGSSYPAEKDLLQQEIERFLNEARTIAPAVPPDLVPTSLKAPQGPLAALISPHIDYRRGSASYGITYSRLAREKHDLYVMLGTAHQYSKFMFHLTAKSFDTPLGTLQCDTGFVHDLATAYGADRAFADEFLHKREHSLELQTPFLKYISPEASVVPILVGSFYGFIQQGRKPEESEEYETLVSALAARLKEASTSGQRVCVIAGVDMAHVGRSFGDEKQLSPQFLESVACRDRMFLDAVAALDHHRLFEHVAEDGDARRLCGFPILYTVLDLLNRLDKNLQTELFDYRQAVDYNKDCAVTFAGAGVFEV